MWAFLSIKLVGVWKKIKKQKVKSFFWMSDVKAYRKIYIWHFLSLRRKTALGQQYIVIPIISKKNNKNVHSKLIYWFFSLILDSSGANSWTSMETFIFLTIDFQKAKHLPTNEVHMSRTQSLLNLFHHLSCTPRGFLHLIFTPHHQSLSFFFSRLPCSFSASSWLWCPWGPAEDPIKPAVNGSNPVINGCVLQTRVWGCWSRGFIR